MAAVKQINANTAVTAALATAKSATETVSGKVRAISDAHGDKIGMVKEHPYVAKIVAATEILWTVLGLVLIFHGAQFKNLFLCAQVLTAFCYGRVRSSILSLYNDVIVAMEKVFADDDKDKVDPDEKKEPENKHAKKRQDKKDSGKPSANREEDAATAKKMLKVVDTDKVTSAVFELSVAFMACHMVMEGGLARAAVITYVLVKASKDIIQGLLDFSEHDDLQVWLDLFLSFVLYCFFGGMAVICSSLALALTLGLVGAQLVVSHGTVAAQSLGKLPEGVTADALAASVKGLAALGGLTAFGALWQFWALMANSSAAWYFHLFYFPAYFAEALVSLL